MSGARRGRAAGRPGERGVAFQARRARPAGGWARGLARLLLALGLLVSGGAWAQQPAPPRVGLRVGVHPGFARVVFDWPQPPAYRSEAREGRLLLRFPPGEINLSAPGLPLRNLAGIARTAEGLELTLFPGVRVRETRLGGRVVIDLLDAPAAEAAAAGTPAAPAVAAPRAPGPPGSPGPLAATPPHATGPVLPAEAPAAPTARPATPAPLAAAPRARPVAGAEPPRPAVGPGPEAPPVETLPARPGAAVAALVDRAPAAMPAETPAAPMGAAPPSGPAPRPAATSALPATGPPRRRSTAPPAAASALGTPPQPAASIAAAAPAAPALPAPLPIQPALPATARPALPEAVPPSGPAAAPAAPEAPPPSVEAATAAGVPAMPPAGALRVQLLAPAGRPPGLRLAFAASVGAAILRRGGSTLVVFDQRQPLDLAALAGHSAFASASTELAPEATLLRLELPPGSGLLARREPAAWVLELLPAAAPMPDVLPLSLGIQQQATPAPGLLVPARKPGRAITLSDPLTGLPLLLGTVLEAGQAFPLPRRFAEIELPPTMLGLAVLARGDHIVLRALTDRFLITAQAPARLALEPATPERNPGGAALSRSFDLPALATGPLAQRLRVQQAEILAAPPLTRGVPRRRAAETLLALGLPQEAQSMLALGAGEDPGAQREPMQAALGAVAALLAGRPTEAAPLAELALPPSDELTFWRGLQAATAGDVEVAGPALAATFGLVLDYPAPLRSRLLPRVAEALASAGETAALRRLLRAAGEDPRLALAEAMLAEQSGQPEAALAGYDAVINGRDRLARARAIGRAVDLRLATGQIDAAAAARALETGLVAWRGDALELATRRRLAGLRRTAGDGRGALALLQETAQLFPEAVAELRPEMSEAFLAMLEQERPLAAIALFDANPELLPPDARGVAATVMLAERLQALDLPERATALLGQALDRMPPGAADALARARLGQHLAALRLAERDGAGALAALGRSEAAELPTELTLSRTLLAARAEARRGDLPAGLRRLEPLGAAGAETRVELLVEAQDWPAAAAAQLTALDAVLPEGDAPVEPAAQPAVLRAAALLALAGDEPGLAALRTRALGRLAEGPLRAAFGAMTAEGLQGLADLPRLQRELQLFRSLPARLEALRTGGSETR